MADVVRIKRRTSPAGAPSALANAEMAYNEASDILYYGKGGSAGTAALIVPIAGTGAFQSRVVIADTAPSSPNIGDFWFDGNKMYIWFSDGTSSQWVPVA